jgi:hypothetical protein
LQRRRPRRRRGPHHRVADDHQHAAGDHERGTDGTDDAGRADHEHAAVAAGE